MATYTARAIRSGHWWAIEVPEVDGVFSQARRLDQVEDTARDAIALVLDVEPASFDVVVAPELPESWREQLTQLHAMRATADVLSAMATLKMREAARALHDEGLAMREIGAAFGVSHQRIHQLLSEPRSTIDGPDLFSLFTQCADPQVTEKVKVELAL